MIEFSKCRIDPKGKHLIIEAAVKDEEFFKGVFIDSIIIDTEETFSPSGPSDNPLATFTYSREVEIPTEPTDEEEDENITSGTTEDAEVVTFSLAKPPIGEELVPDEFDPSIKDPIDGPVVDIEPDEGETEEPEDGGGDEEGDEEPTEEEPEEEIKTEIKSDTKEISIELTSKMLNLDSFNDHVFFVYVKTIGTPSPMTPCGQDNIVTMAVAVNFEPIYNTALGYIKEIERTCKAPQSFIDMILRVKAFQLALKTGNYPLVAKFWTKLFKGRTAGIVERVNNCGCNGV